MFPPKNQIIAAAVLLGGAGFAGLLAGTRHNLHDQEMFFYLTNPDGPAGNFAAARTAKQSVVCACANSAAANEGCGGPAQTWPADQPTPQILDLGD